jgi:alpha/beta superfamily hydrolase
MTRDRFTIPGPAGALDAVLDAPAAGVPARAAVAVLCHPLPIAGGSMDNKVVTTLARAFALLGAASLRFNFRGVSASAGQFDHGRGEADDLDAVIAHVRTHWPGHALWLAGFSFGAAMAWKRAATQRADLLVTVAPPVGRDWGIETTPAPACPWLLVQGDADEIVSAPAVLAWAARQHPGPRVRTLAGAGHFFHGRLPELRETVRSGVDALLGGTPA